VRIYAVRLKPGIELKNALHQFTMLHNIQAGAILTCVGSLSKVTLRMPGSLTQAQLTHTAPTTLVLEDKFEIISLVGTLDPQGRHHLHLSVSDTGGKVIGGHMQHGNIVRTTAEIVIADLEQFVFSREQCDASGWDELVITGQDGQRVEFNPVQDPSTFVDY